MSARGDFQREDNQYGALITPVYYSFTLGSPEPGTAGGRNTVTITGAPPDTQIDLVAGRYGGGHYIPNCTNQQNLLQIEYPHFLRSVITDATGAAEISLFVPETYADSPILLQAFIRDSCEISNLVDVTFD